MKTFIGNNFSKVYYDMLCYTYNSKAKLDSSRGGSVKDTGPAYFEISNDNFRIPLLKKRGFNPFFVLSESSWILSGLNTVSPLDFFIKDYAKFSDDGTTLNGAYGYRLRNKFGYDQINRAISLLKNNPSTRRVVLSLWSTDDLGYQSNDLPCNISIILKVRSGKLDITVINRSNDVFLGVPHNVFVFFMLQVYIAKGIGCEVGIQRHFTDSLHLYERDMDQVKEILSANNEAIISSLIEKIPSFDTKTYADVNHNEVTNLEFQEIHQDYRIMFELFREYKNGSKDVSSIINRLPCNMLGYSGLLWFEERKGFEINNKYFYELSLEGGNVLDDTILNFDFLKNETSEKIAESAKSFSSKYSNFVDELIHVTEPQNSFFTINREKLDEMKFLQSIHLSLVFASATASFLNVYLKDEYITRIQNAANLLNLNMKDIVDLTKFEGKLVQVLNNNNIV
ncbi:hypothetical protein A8L34_25805 [Bacillus sp. FJAT-27264]|uniref:thymidylate synthase n=1 Tax=Paenibacillus sp. (strain DSM 101736 / FJAT-27264) TaxID=1850362 RepID=UPI000807F757|nr:thymidylate synthase [Bacillus sp. FJAT-27264]OBZ07552.1 hypothetical protein A8L34_25805 [Bacillus sp. FJAT-27264]